jgi:hypothetical protein
MSGNAEMVAYLQRVCGYCLTGETTEQAMFFGLACDQRSVEGLMHMAATTGARACIRAFALSLGLAAMLAAAAPALQPS